MSGHSKWKTIKHKKGIADAKRGKLFTKIARVITIAAKEGGGDPESNFKLRLAMDKAKQANMPKENVKRAIDRGIGKSGEASNFKEVIYEGFGPEGTAFMVEITSDNTNRTNSELRTLFSKNGGNLAGSGAVSYLFDHVGYLLVDIPQDKHEEKILELMEIEGIKDVDSIREGIEVYTVQDRLAEVKDLLTDQGLSVKESELIYNPKTLIKVNDKSVCDRLINFTEIIEDHDDVQKVYSNFDIVDELINS